MRRLNERTKRQLFLHTGEGGKQGTYPQRKQQPVQVSNGKKTGRIVYYTNKKNELEEGIRTSGRLIRFRSSLQQKESASVHPHTLPSDRKRAEKRCPRLTIVSRSHQPVRTEGCRERNRQRRVSESKTHPFQRRTSSRRESNTHWIWCAMSSRWQGGHRRRRQHPNPNVFRPGTRIHGPSWVGRNALEPSGR